MRELSPLGRRSTFVALASLVVVQAALSVVLVSHDATVWGGGECPLLREARLLFERDPAGALRIIGANPGALVMAVPVAAFGPGALAAKVAVIVANAALLALVAAALYTTGERNGAIMAAALLAAAPTALRGPFLDVGVGPMSTALLMTNILLVSLLRERWGQWSDLLTGTIAGLGLALDQWFGILLPILVVVRYRRGDSGWWRPVAVAAGVVLLLALVTTGGVIPGRWTLVTPTLIEGSSGAGIASIMTLPSALAILVVAVASLATLVRPPTGARGELAVAAGLTGAIVLVVALASPLDPILAKEELALAWVLLIPAAAAGIRDLVPRRRHRLLTLVAVAALGAWDLQLAPASTGFPTPACRESIDGTVRWDLAAPGIAGCPDGSTPWEGCFHRAGRDAVWNMDALSPDDDLPRPTGHFYALGVGEGLYEFLGPAREGELARSCDVFGPELADICVGGFGSRAASDLMADQEPATTPCAQLDKELQGRCAQGLGAGFLLETRKQELSVKEGLDFCTPLPSELHAHCVRGFAQSLGFARRGNSDTDPSNWRHCTGLPEQYYVQCMGGHAANFGWAGELSLESGIKSCVSPFQESVSKFCLVNFGCSLGFHFSGESQRAWDICKSLPNDIIAYCVEGLGDGIGFANPGDLAASVKACDVLPIEHRSICYHRIGNDLSLFLTDDLARMIELCAQEPSRARPYCFEGAGEAVGWPTAPNITASILGCEKYPPAIRHYCHYGLCESYGCKLGKEPDDPVALWHELPPEGKPFCAEGLGDSLGWRFGYNTTDAMALCDWLPDEDDQELCYLNVADRIHWRYGKGPEAIERCLALPSNKTGPCMRGLGRFASWQFGSLLAGRENVCAHEPLPGRPFCAMMFGRNVLLKEGMTAAKEACDGLGELAPDCWRGVGWALGWLVRTEGLPEVSCPHAGDLAPSCHEGLCTGLAAVLGDAMDVLETAGDIVERGTCLSGLGAGLVWYTNDDSAAVALDCAALPPPDAKACAQGAGMDIAQESLYLYGTADKAREFCMEMDAPLAEACLAGVENA